MWRDLIRLGLFTLDYITKIVFPWCSYCHPNANKKGKSNQKDGNSSPDGLSCKDIAPVVAVLGYSVDARQHCQANQGQTDKGAGQTPPSGASAAHNIHLSRTKHNTCEWRIATTCRVSPDSFLLTPCYYHVTIVLLHCYKMSLSWSVRPVW